MRPVREERLADEVALRDDLPAAGPHAAVAGLRAVVAHREVLFGAGDDVLNEVPLPGGGVGGGVLRGVRQRPREHPLEVHVRPPAGAADPVAQVPEDPQPRSRPGRAPQADADGREVPARRQRVVQPRPRVAGGPAEVDGHAVDPQGQLVVEVGEPQRVEAPAADRDRGLRQRPLLVRVHLDVDGHQPRDAGAGVDPAAVAVDALGQLQDDLRPVPDLREVQVELRGDVRHPQDALVHLFGHRPAGAAAEVTVLGAGVAVVGAVVGDQPGPRRRPAAVGDRPPVVRRGHQVRVRQPRGLRRRLRQRAGGARFLPAVAGPPLREAGLPEGRHREVVVVHEDGGRPPLAGVVHPQDLLAAVHDPVQVPAADAGRLAGHADEALDVVLLRAGGPLEDEHVEPLRLAEVEGPLVDDDVVPVEGHRVLHVVGEPAVGARRERDAGAGQHDGGALADLRAGADLVVEAAGVADALLVAAVKRGGHRPRRDHERLHQKRPARDQQHEGVQQLVEGVPRALGRRGLPGGGLRPLGEGEDDLPRHRGVFRAGRPRKSSRRSPAGSAAVFRSTTAP